MASDSNSNDPNPTAEGQDLSWRERGLFPALAIFLFGPTLKQERVGALPWVRRILLGWPRTQAGPHSTSAKEGVDGQTDPLLLRLARLGIAMLVVICFYGFSLGISPGLRLVERVPIHCLGVDWGNGRSLVRPGAGHVVRTSDNPRMDSATGCTDFPRGRRKHIAKYTAKYTAERAEGSAGRRRARAYQ